MASRHENPGLRVVGAQPGQETSPDREKLAETPFSGNARLRELQQLANTARRVREDAERELADSRTSRAIAEQRISTCERTIRKAEEEMAEIRADLYHREHLGDDASDFKSSEDFELAVLLGKTARHEERSEQNTAALELSPLPKLEKQRQPQQPKPVPFRSVARDIHNPKGGNTRRIGFILLVTASAVVGASITYTALKSPAIQKNVAAIATDPGQLIEEVKKAVTKPAIAPALENKTHETEPSATEPPVAPAPETTANSAQDTPPATRETVQPRTGTQPDLFQQRAVEEQRARVMKEAEANLKVRAQNAATARNILPAKQAPEKDIASGLHVRPDPGQLAGPLPLK